MNSEYENKQKEGKKGEKSRENNSTWSDTTEGEEFIELNSSYQA